MQIALMSIAQIKVVRVLAKLTLLNASEQYFFVMKIYFLKGKVVKVQHFNWLKTLCWTSSLLNFRELIAKSSIILPLTQRQE